MSMKRTLSAIAISLSLSMGSVAAADDKAGGETSEKAMKPDWTNIETHLEQHQTFPATKAELVSACNNLSDFSDSDKKWFAATLPEGTYESPQDVVKALKSAGKKKM
jgi:hypothetical protein